jgi:hypothetical protein
VLIQKSTVAFFVRALLWIVLIVAPGGVLLLPFLVGDEVARRKRAERAAGPDLTPSAPKSQRTLTATATPAP